MITVLGGILVHFGFKWNTLGHWKGGIKQSGLGLYGLCQAYMYINKRKLNYNRNLWIKMLFYCSVTTCYCCTLNKRMLITVNLSEVGFHVLKKVLSTTDGVCCKSFVDSNDSIIFGGEGGKAHLIQYKAWHIRYYRRISSGHCNCQQNNNKSAKDGWLTNTSLPQHV